MCVHQRGPGIKRERVGAVFVTWVPHRVVKFRQVRHKFRLQVNRCEAEVYEERLGSLAVLPVLS